MSLVPSLLRAIVTIDGDALVLHVGDKPYVLSASGQIDLAPRGLTYDSVAGVIAQLLPEDSQKALQEFGAAQHELPNLVHFPGDQSTVVGAGGGEDVWVEIRRGRQPGSAQEHRDGTEESSGEIAPADTSIRVTSAPRPVEFPGVSALWPDPSPVVEPVGGEQPP